MNANNTLIKKLQSGSIRGIIFDFDGTILDISQPLRDSIEEVYQEKKIEADIDLTIQEIGALMETIQGYPLPKIILESYDMFKYISSLQSISFLKKLQIATKIFSRYLTYAKEANFFPDVLELLNKLKKTFDLFILSHNQTKNIIPHLEENNVKDHFKGVFGADLLPELKPSPVSLEPVFESYESCKLDEFVIIGDMPSDIEAGKEAGIWTIAVTTGVSKKEVLSESNPDLIIDSLHDLLKLIEKKTLSDTQESLKVKS